MQEVPLPVITILRFILVTLLLTSAGLSSNITPLLFFSLSLDSNYAYYSTLSLLYGRGLILDHIYPPPNNLIIKLAQSPEPGCGTNTR